MKSVERGKGIKLGQKVGKGRRKRQREWTGGGRG